MSYVFRKRLESSIRHIPTKWLVLLVVCTATVPLGGLGGIEGTMEFALDAPWRIEPNLNSLGIREYGAIPLQVTIHDTDIIPVDVPGHTLGNFCALIVGEDTATGYGVGRFELDDLAEIERSGPWRSTSSSQPSESCRPDEAPDRCERLRGLSNTAEWHALAWYRPLTRLAGRDIPLTLTAKITKKGSIACDSARESDLYTLRNHVTVHLGEAAMPRFDNRWLYGDLHYHSQGTDNEGEAGYNYRGVIRAMGAMGLDFAVAAEHASNSLQYSDIDQSFALSPCPVDIGATRNRLRDMSLNRFRYLRSALHGSAGVNRTAAFAGSSGRYPQGYLSHGVIPQLMLGGELDAIPETDTTDRYVTYGNGLTYDMNAMRRGTRPEAECFVARGYKFWDETPTGWLVGDVQGLNRSGYGREHLVYIPFDGNNRDAFVASDTSDFGGARRRLADAHDGVDALLPEIAQKGYAFLAHPLNAPHGDAGPDGPPWPDFMIRKAWESPGVLGLQFWNEPAHLETKMGVGDAAERGYEWPLRLGFYTGTLELTPYYDMARRLYASRLTGVEHQLHHGAYMWDVWLLRGLDTQQTNPLSWLPTGQPRRFFMAAGSDAHGDLNYRRNGYLFGTEKVKDVAIAKARNLVFAGDPELPPDEVVARDSRRMPPPRHSHKQIADALASGNFTATDGPALRIVVDRNRNGAIDDGDVPMGGVIDMQGELLPLLVEWRSTAEFGGVTRLSLYVGVHNDRGSIDGGFRVYAPALHGPRNFATLPDATVTESYQQGSCTYERMRDNYWRDPTGLLGIQLARPSMNGVLPINLPLSAFQANLNERGNRFYVRAFAETERQDADGCASSADARRAGACIRHYAFTNPIWAITSVPPWQVPGPGSWTCQRPRG